MIEFDQYVEYVTEGPAIHAVTLQQHSLESPLTLLAVAAGYVHEAELGRAILSGAAELAMCFCEWTPAGGLPSTPGIVASMILAGWTAKSVAAAYVIANTATLDAINASRTTAVALIRLSLVNGGTNLLAPDLPATSQQVTALSTWLNNHAITNTEFAALFGITAAQLSAWLQSHPRWMIAAQMKERFA